MGRRKAPPRRPSSNVNTQVQASLPDLGLSAGTEPPVRAMSRTPTPVIDPELGSPLTPFTERVSNPHAVPAVEDVAASDEADSTSDADIDDFAELRVEKGFVVYELDHGVKEDHAAQLNIPKGYSTEIAQRVLDHVLADKFRVQAPKRCHKAYAGFEDVFPGQGQKIYQAAIFQCKVFFIRYLTVPDEEIPKLFRSIVNKKPQKGTSQWSTFHRRVLKWRALWLTKFYAQVKSLQAIIMKRRALESIDDSARLKEEYGKEYDTINLRHLFRSVSVGEAVNWTETTRTDETKKYWRNFFATAMLLAHRTSQNPLHKASAYMGKLKVFTLDKKYATIGRDTIVFREQDLPGRRSTQQEEVVNEEVEEQDSDWLGPDLPSEM